MNEKTIFITCTSGFISAYLVMNLLRQKESVSIIGMDNMNDYYNVSLKEYRLSEIEKLAKDSASDFVFVKGNIADKDAITDIFNTYHPDIVVNPAAQAGVRYSTTNPDAYIEANLIVFYIILEACHHSYDNGAKGVEHSVYASSLSVYGCNTKISYSTDDKVDNPISLYYATTKKSNELIRMHIQSYTIFLQRAFVSLQCMVLLNVLIWRILVLLISFEGKTIQKLCPF